MSLTNDQLLDRIVEIEALLTTIQTAMNNLATRKEVKNVVALISQTELTNESEIEDRLSTIETKVNDIQSALNNVASKQTMKSLAAIKQAEVEALKDRVTALESQIAILQG